MFNSVEESLSKGPLVEKPKGKPGVINKKGAQKGPWGGKFGDSVNAVNTALEKPKPVAEPVAKPVAAKRMTAKNPLVIDKQKGKDPWGGEFGDSVNAVNTAAKDLKTLKTPVPVRELTPAVRRERRRLDTPFVNKEAADGYKDLRANPKYKNVTNTELKTIANKAYRVVKSMFNSVENSMFKGVLTTEDREDLKEKQFALPKKAEDKEEKAESGNYPIPDLSHARNALAMVAQHGTPAEQAQVRAAVHKKYPELDNQTDEESKMDKSLPSAVNPARAAAFNEPIISRGNTTRRQVAEHMAKSFNTGAPVFVEEPFNGRLRKGVVIPKGQDVKEAEKQVAGEQKGRVDTSGSKVDLKAAIVASRQPETSKQKKLLTKLKPVQSRTFKTVAPQQPGLQAPIVKQSSPARDEMIASMKASPSNTQVSTFINKMGGYGGQLSGEAGANQTVKFGRSSAQKEFNNFTDAQKNQVWSAFKRGVKRTSPSATAKSPVVQKLREGLGLGQPQVAPGKEVKPR